jgi:hypothetical protein
MMTSFGGGVSLQNKEHPGTNHHQYSFHNVSAELKFYPKTAIMDSGTFLDLRYM